MDAIKTDRLTKYYGKTLAVSELDLDVKCGEFFGFIGPNGAGKSTTIRTLLGLLNPSSGSASVLGLDIQKERTQILKRVGFLPSETSFYDGMRVKDILTFCAKMRKTDCSKQAKELCDRLELDVTKKANELSLGNRKKVGIVAALQHDPELYILDEPTSGLDPLIQHEFYSILKERNKNGATVFLSSHILSDIDRYCDRAAIIRDGRIIAQGDINTLAGQNTKRVILNGVGSIPTIENATDLHLENGNLSFLYSGNAKALISAINCLEFDDLSISEPELDEVFSHYYKREERL